MEIFERLKLVLIEKNLRPADLAHILKKSQGNIASILKGNVKPSSDFLTLLQEKLDININWILSGDGEMSLYNPPTEEELLEKRRIAAEKWGVSEEEADELLKYAIKFKGTGMLETLFKAEKGDKEALFELEGMIKLIKSRLND